MEAGDCAEKLSAGSRRRFELLLGIDLLLVNSRIIRNEGAG
jgi:hypothetical protein